MGAVAGGVVGAPITMTLLVLETTGNFSLTMGVMASVIACSVVVRQSFGYSFATWRFHARGLRIKGAHDVGWIADLTVGKLMRKDVQLVPASETIAELREHFPLGGPKYAFVLNGRGAYIGTIETVEAHSSAYDEGADITTAEALIHDEPHVLTAQENIHSAIQMFTKTASEILPVAGQRQVGPCRRDRSRRLMCFGGTVRNLRSADPKRPTAAFSAPRPLDAPGRCPAPMTWK